MVSQHPAKVDMTSLKIERGQLVVKNESGETLTIDLKTHVVAKK